MTIYSLEDIDIKAYSSPRWVEILGRNACLASSKNAVQRITYTGMRIEEICRLKTTSVEDSLFKVEDSKTVAGIREVPIHSAIADRINQLCEASTDGFIIFSDAKNKYGKRSDTLSKRFATIRTALGFGSEHVFHSIRKTVATLLEHAGVTESVAADIMGHEKPTMTFGLYSGGSSMEQRREAIERLVYGIP